MSYENLEFWAEKPREVFELNVDLTIPAKPEYSVTVMDKIIRKTAQGSPFRLYSHIAQEISEHQQLLYA
jgi:hypothetical protein